MHEAGEGGTVEEVLERTDASTSALLRATSSRLARGGNDARGCGESISRAETFQIARLGEELGSEHHAHARQAPHHLCLRLRGQQIFEMLFDLRDALPGPQHLSGHLVDQ